LYAELIISDGNKSHKGHIDPT